MIRISRAPLERVFSQDNKRIRYRGIAKNQFAHHERYLFQFETLHAF